MLSKHVKRALIFAMLMALAAVNAGATSVGIIGGADGPTQVFITRSTQAPLLDTQDAWDEADDSSGESLDGGADDWGEDEAAFGEDPDDSFDSSSGESLDGGEDGWDDAPVDDAGAQKTNLSEAERASVEAVEEARFAALHTPVENPDLTIDAVLGYGGTVTFGRQIPFTVTIKNGGADLDGSVCVNLYRNRTYYDRVELPLYLAAGSEKQVSVPVTLESKQDEYTIEYCVNGTTVASKSFKPDEVVDPSVVLIGALSGDPASLTYMSLSAKNDPMMRGEYFKVIPLTPDAFPSSEGQLEAFSLLVVDGADLRTLTDAQKRTFDAWLKAGGIVIVGGGAGAAAGYPFFEDYTGIRAGALNAADDVTPDLMEYLGVAEPALGQSVMVCAMRGAEQALVSSSPAEPLIDLKRVERGLVYTAAFELGARPLTEWQGISALWQRVLLKSVPTAYQSMFQGGYSFGWGYNSDESDSARILRQLPVDNPYEILPVVLLLAGYLLISGVLCYFILKKLDKRELLWALMPALAVCCALAVWGMSQGAGFNTPVATTYTRLVLSEQNTPDMKTYVGVASQDSAPVLASAGAGVALKPIDTSDSYEYGYDNMSVKTPGELRYRYIYGEPMQLGFPASSAWDGRLFTLTGGAAFTGGIDARIWMEDDGMHASVTNQTGYPLRNCAVVTSLGFASMPDIAPGESAQAAITFPSPEEEQLVKDALANDNFSLVLDGRMLSQSQMMNRYGDMYQFIYALCFPEEQIANAEARAQAMRNPGSGRKTAEARYAAIQNRMYQWTSETNLAAFRFIAFSDELGTAQPLLNGRSAQRAAHLAMIDKAIAYEPVGPTGLVYYPAGLLVPEQASADNGAPAFMDVAAERDAYYQLSTRPAFGVRLPEGLVVDELVIAGTYYDDMPTCMLYNHVSRAWDEQKTAYVTLKGEDAAPYVGDDGALFVRYAPSVSVESSRYSGVAAPSITLKGRVSP